jgi:hypothetical protein
MTTPLLITLLLCSLWTVLIFSAVRAARKKPRADWRQCAWCKWWVSSEGHFVEQRPVEVREGEAVSHGICKDCRDRELKALATLKPNFFGQSDRCDHSDSTPERAHCRN